MRRVVSETSTEQTNVSAKVNEKASMRHRREPGPSVPPNGAVGGEE